MKQTYNSWRVDEIYVKVRGKLIYLYRSVDSSGHTLDILANQTCSTRAAKWFFRKFLGRSPVAVPRVINVDNIPTYIGSVRDIKRDNLLPKKCKDRPSKYTNNMVEQDHLFIKRRVNQVSG